MFSALSDMGDTRFVNIASHLSPAWVRVGGISCDFVEYSVPGYPPPAPTPAPATWGSAAKVFTTAQFDALLSFLGASQLRLMFDVNELVGRTCNFTHPNVPYGPGEWCEGSWNMSNVRNLLQWIRDQGLYGSNSTLGAFSAGNELRVHLDSLANAQDIISLVALVQEVWSDVPAASRPPVFGTDTGTSRPPLSLVGQRVFE
jgi:hypothetical protein